MTGQFMEYQSMISKNILSGMIAGVSLKCTLSMNKEIYYECRT